MATLQDYSIGVSLVFNPGNAVSGAQSAAQAFTDLGTKMGSAGQASGALASSFTSMGQSTSQVNSSLGATSNSLNTTNTSLNTTKTNLTGTNTTLGQTNSALGTTNTDFGALNNVLGTTNTALGTTSTELKTAGTDLSTLDTNVTTANTELGTMNTTLDTTNTTMGEVTTAITTQDPEMKDLTTTWDQYVTASKEAITAMEQELTPMKDITTTLGEQLPISKDLTTSINTMSEGWKNSGPPLASLNAQVAEHNTTTATAKTNTEGWSQSLVTTGLSITTAFSGIVSLAKGIRDYNDGQIRVIASEKKVLDAREKLDDATRKASDALAKYGKDSEITKKAMLDQTEASKGYEVALLKQEKAAKAFGDTQLGIVVNSFQTVLGLIGTVAGGWGNYQKMLVTVTTALGGAATANEVAAGSFVTIGKGADAAKLSMLGLAQQAAATAVIIYGIIELAKAIPELMDQIKNYQASIDPKNSLLTQTDANIARKKASLEQLTSPDPLAQFGARIGAFGNDIVNKGAKFGTTEADLKSQLTDYTNLKNTILEVAKARGINVNAVKLEDVQAWNLSKNIKVLGTDNKTLNDIVTAGTSDAELYANMMGQWGAQTKKASIPILEMEPALQGFIDKTIEVNDPLNKNNTLMGIQASAVGLVTKALGDHTTGLLSVTDQGNALVKGIQAQNIAFQAEEKDLLLTANSLGVLDDANSAVSQSLIDMAVSTADNTTAMKETIAVNIDYTKALTDTETHAKLVADGHLAGAVALKEYFDGLVSGQAQQELFNAGIAAYVEVLGGLPAGIKDTVENQKLWIEAVNGSEEALAALDKQIQDQVIKDFGDMQKAFEQDVASWAAGGDAADELKEKLKDLIPKEIREPIILNMEVKAAEDSIKESISLMERHLFTVIQTGAGKTQYAYQANVEATVNENSGVKMLEKLKSSISDALDKGDISSVTADKLTTAIDQGITAIHADPAHASDKVLETFGQLDTIAPELGKNFGILTDKAVQAMGVPQGAIDAAKKAMGEVGTQGSAAYQAALIAQLQKQGADPQVIENVKKSFANVPAEGKTAGTDTGNAFSTALQEAVALGQAQIDITTTVFSTMTGAWVTFNDTVLKLEEQLVQGLVTLYTETLYGQGIGAMLVTASDSWRAYDEVVVAQEGELVNALVALYGETLLNDGIVAMLATATESWTSYNEIVIEQEELLVTAIVGLYVETLYTAIGQMLITAAGSFRDYEEVVLKQEDELITGLAELYGETLLNDVIVATLVSAEESWTSYEETVVGTEEKLIQALVDLYVKTLYGDGIGPMLVEAAKSFKDYESTILGTEEQNVEDIITEYESMTDQITQVLDDIGKAFEDAAEEWLTTVEDVVEDIISEFETIPDQVSQVVDDINSEIDKITKSVTVKVNYDTSGKPKATGADEFYPARAQAGIDFKTKRGQPQLLIVGEGATPERVTISRPGEPAYSGMGRSEEAGGGGGGTVVVNDTINVYTQSGEYLGGARTRRVFRNLESH